MLILENVHKKFDLNAGFFAKWGKFVHAVNGVSFRIRDNETYGLVGESGCGKTTIARLIVQMYRTDDGSIIFKDRKSEYNIGRLDRDSLKNVRGKIKYIFQDPAKSLNPRMNVAGILTEGYRYSRHWTGRKDALSEARKILNDVGLSANDVSRRPGDFSGGQRQRISIARALMMRPELLICDEVVSALDVSIQSQILQLLLNLKKRYRLSMLFIAHDLTVVSYFCDRIGVMYAGVLIEEAGAKELIRKRYHPYTEHLYKSIPLINKKKRSGDANGEVTIGMPDQTVPLSGCPYYERCGKRQLQCLDGIPKLREVAKGHKVACRLA